MAAGPLFAEQPPAAINKSRPNIIFILADDLGIGSLNCYGADHFQTPNIDKLAASGIRFEHCYTSPLCGPSRALLLSGRYGFRTGMTSNATGDRMTPASEILIPKVLKQEGYATGHVGKWAQLPLEPGDWGFDEYLRFKGSGLYWNTQKNAHNYIVNGEKAQLLDNDYLPDKMHEFAVSFIKRHKDQPFYLHYALSHVHTAILPTPDSSPANKKLEEGSIPLYQDNIAYLDKLVGKLMTELEQLKLREKTIIIFAGDNGSMKTYMKYCTINGGKPLSGCKHTMLEGGALVPMIISWPGTTPAGSVSQNLISFGDFFPTFAELTGAKLPPEVTIDGKPFTPMFYGKSIGNGQRDSVFVLLEHEWYVRELNWKMNQAGELFNMKNAPFDEPLVPASPEKNEASAARQRLQAVLEQLNPAAGKVDPSPPGSTKHGNEKSAKDLEKESDQ